MKSILDPSFKYVPSVDTDLRKTFARVRRERRKATLQAEADRAEAERKSIVLPVGERKRRA